jgi:hypothetical protein
MEQKGTITEGSETASEKSDPDPDPNPKIKSFRIDNTGRKYLYSCVPFIEALPVWCPKYAKATEIAVRDITTRSF